MNNCFFLIMKIIRVCKKNMFVFLFVKFVIYKKILNINKVLCLVNWFCFIGWFFESYEDGGS